MPKTKPAFVQFIEETLSPLEARCKSMFGGWGVYVQDRMMGLIVEDVLYLKTDSENVAMFRNAKLEPFIYETSTKRISMSYYRAPEDLLEDWEQLEPWVMSAVAAANRKPKKPNKENKK
jgi:DNA transformation protein and related proteins